LKICKVQGNTSM